MAESQSILVLTDAIPSTDAKQGFPGFDRISRMPELHEVDIKTIQRNLATLLRAVSVIAQDPGVGSSEFELDEVVFQAAIDASGNVSIVSVLGAGSAGRTGIELRLRRRRMPTQSRPE